jgi:hypothetical protein
MRVVLVGAELEGNIGLRYMASALGVRYHSPSGSFRAFGRASTPTPSPHGERSGRDIESPFGACV